MKTSFSSALVLAFSSVAVLPFATASAAPVARIPAFGMSCEATDGSLVFIVPEANGTQAAVEVIAADGRTVSDNIHALSATTKNGKTIYTLAGWLEQDQVAKLTLVSEESMVGASFKFQFDSSAELGVARSLRSCDVM